jgi:hypothetical protein
MTCTLQKEIMRWDDRPRIQRERTVHSLLKLITGVKSNSNIMHSIGEGRQLCDDSLH